MRPYVVRDGSLEDMPALRLIHESSMRPHIEAQFGSWGSAQIERFERTTKPEEHQILEVNGSPIGCVLIKVESDYIRLVRIYLLPEYQNQGIGSDFLKYLFRKADSCGLPVRLQVLKVNRAADLYKRLGFASIDETETHYILERQPNDA